MPIRRRPSAAPVPEVALGVAAVARRLGVATGTLRTWDRRYGLGPSAHESGTRRRYSGTDLARLSLMRRLMLEGVAAAEAAAAAVAATEGELAAAGHALPSAPAADPQPARRRRSAGGGRVVPLRDAGPAARGLARAAMALDGDACTELLRTSVARSGVVSTWDEVLVPVLTGIGDRWHSTGSGVEVEHLLSECAETALRGVAATGRPLNARPVLLAALEPEDHRLPLVALAAALTERRVGTRLLGPRLPAKALGDAVSRTGALAVVLWAQGAAGAAATRLPHPVLAAVRPKPALLLGGPGWNPERLPEGAGWLPDLAAAADATAALVGGAVSAAGHR